MAKLQRMGYGRPEFFPEFFVAYFLVFNQALHSGWKSAIRIFFQFFFNILKIPILAKFTFWKIPILANSHFEKSKFLQNSRYENIIFHEIHILKFWCSRKSRRLDSSTYFDTRFCALWISFPKALLM